jgi:hypothetical protein
MNHPPEPKRTRRRPSAPPLPSPALQQVEANTQASQAVIDGVVSRIIDGVVESDAAIVADICQSLNPMTRLGQIIGQVAQRTPIGQCPKEDADALIAALDKLRYALDPALRPALPSVIARAFTSVQAQGVDSGASRAVIARCFSVGCFSSVD